MRAAVFPLGMLCSVAAHAAGQAATSAGKFADPAVAVVAPVSAASSMGRVTIALVIVLGVLFAAAWAMRQFKLFSRNGKGALQIEQGINLGPKERAVLVNVQGRRLLLGVASGCVNLLMELPARADDAASQPSKADNSPPNFKDLLKRSMGLS